MFVCLAGLLKESSSLLELPYMDAVPALQGAGLSGTWNDSCIWQVLMLLQQLCGLAASI